MNRESPSNETYEFKAVPTVEKFYNEDSAWGCYILASDTELPNSKFTNRYDYSTNKYFEAYQVTLTGKVPRLTTGLEYSFKAKLVHNKKYGYGYEASVGQDVPKSMDSQRTFLCSIITERQASVLLEQYPNIVQEVVDGTDNVDLEKTKGIKEFTWNLIKERILQNYSMADLLSMLAPLGVTYNKIILIK